MSRLAWWCWSLVSLEFVVGLPLVCWLWGYRTFWWPPSWIIGVSASLALLWLMQRTGT